jgi:hypothetical protein
MKKQFTITIDEELIEQIKSITNKGDVSKQVEEWIRVGLEKKSPKNSFVELLHLVKKLNDDRKNGLIVFNERVSGLGGD